MNILRWVDDLFDNPKIDTVIQLPPPLPEDKKDTEFDILVGMFEKIEEKQLDYEGDIQLLTEKLSAGIDTITTKLINLDARMASLESATKEAIRKDEELHGIKTQLHETNIYVQELLKNMMSNIVNNLHKSPDTANVNPVIAKYLERKNGHHPKLP